MKISRVKQWNKLSKAKTGCEVKNNVN